MNLTTRVGLILDPLHSELSLFSKLRNSKKEERKARSQTHQDWGQNPKSSRDEIKTF